VLLLVLAAHRDCVVALASDSQSQEEPCKEGLLLRCAPLDSARTGASRPVEIEDVIAMKRLADPVYLGGGSSAGRVAQFSPDGKKFVVVLRKGNLQSNSNEYSMLLWQTDSLFHAPKSDVLLTLSSTSNRPAIQSVTWLDNEAVLFLGESRGKIQQLYSINCRTRQLRAITHSRTNVLAYGTAGADTIAYTAETLRPREEATGNRQGRVITTQLITEVLTGRPEEHWADHVRLLLQSQGTRKQTLTLDDHLLMPFPFPEDHPVVSPDGHYVLVLANVERIPAVWREYPDSRMQKWTHWDTEPGQYSMLRQYVLFDVKTKQNSVLLNAPISLGGGADSEAAWSPDSESVVITNTYLPLEETSSEERESRLGGPFIAEVRVRTGEITKISSRELKLIRWDRRTNELIFEEGRAHGGPSGSRLYLQKRDSVWESVSHKVLVPQPPRILLEEGMNEPPQIVAAQPDGQQRAVLLELNPQFQHLKFGREELIRWNARDGHEVEGGLYYPVDYIPGRRYPLVIQTHGFRPDRFDVDGPYPSAFAAQPLAGRGIMVLQSEKPDQREVIRHLATETEAAWRVSAYEGAIDYLDARGLVDRDRVGIIGFSRTCWYVKYALTQSGFRFAAASISDGFDMGYFSYVAMANRSYPDNEMDQIMGSAPTGEGVKNWIEHSPGFNIDRVPHSLPLRIVASYPLDVMVEWEWFSLMKRLHKPVDMIVFLDGVHLLQKPWDRMISQGGNVDWFDFWLNGHEDPDRAKADQYQRWRQLRNTANEVKAGQDRSWEMPDAGFSPAAGSDLTLRQICMSHPKAGCQNPAPF
jgi:dipeptidyl aminopeptidase/acylaminoacyl peptidase